MKNFLVTLAEIAFGVALFFLILAPVNSFSSETTRIFNSVVTDLKTIP